MTADIQETHAVLRQLAELPIPLRDRLTDHLASNCGPVEQWRLKDLKQTADTLGIALQTFRPTLKSSPIW